MNGVIKDVFGNDIWLQAEQYFAKDMIYGTGDLFRYVELGNIRSSDIWKYLHHDTFDRLENVWLSDVFQLRAYEIWLEKGSVVTSDRTAIDMDLRNACSQFTERMLNDAIKYPEEARGILEGYLQEKLKLGKGPIFEDQEPFLTLINKKATRIKELSGHADRSRTQQYVLDFYRPLYGAVVTEDEKAKYPDENPQAKLLPTSGRTQSNNKNASQKLSKSKSL